MRRQDRGKGLLIAMRRGEIGREMRILVIITIDDTNNLPLPIQTHLM